MERRLIGVQLATIREAKGITVAQAATRSGLRVEQVENVEAGHAKYSTAQRLASVFGKYVTVRGFFKQKGVSAAHIARQAGIDVATAAQCIRKANSPANTPDCDVLSLELVLFALSDRATLSLSDHK